MDAQHRQLLNICSNLEELIDQNCDVSKEAFHESIHHLCEYARQHFAEEEAMLTAIGYPKVEEQIREHLAYQIELMRYVDAVISGVDLREHLLEFGRKWWSSHILESDMEYKAFVAQ